MYVLGVWLDAKDFKRMSTHHLILHLCEIGIDECRTMHSITLYYYNDIIHDIYVNSDNWQHEFWGTFTLVLERKYTCLTLPSKRSPIKPANCVKDGLSSGSVRHVAFMTLYLNNEIDLLKFTWDKFKIL